MNQNSKPLKIEDKPNITPVTKWCTLYKKWRIIQFNLEIIYLRKSKMLSFAKNIGKIIGKSLSKNWGSNHSQRILAACQKLLDCTWQSATYTIKTTSRRVVQKIAEATGDLIADKIAVTEAKL